MQVADLKRLESWILALKLRYWIDVGNRSQYNVDWLRKLDDKGDLAGIRIKLFEASDEDSQGQNINIHDIFNVKARFTLCKLRILNV